MKFKTFVQNYLTNYVILESFADFGNLVDDIKSFAEEIKKKREERKKIEEEVEKLRKDKKKEKDAKKKKKIADKIKKKKKQVEKIAKETKKLVDEKQKAEDKQGNSDSSSNDNKEETTLEKPEVPDVEDLPLGKMKDGDVRKLIKYYQDMTKYINGKMSGAETEQKAKYKKSIEGFNAEISDLKNALDKENKK